MGKVNVRLATGNDRNFMENIIEKYLYEMSPYSGIGMDSVGNYSYSHLGSYFRSDRTAKRRLYIIEVDGERAGFAMLNAVSPFDEVAEGSRPSQHEKPDWCMAEFTVFPAFRNQGVGRDATELIVANNPGKWELMFDERNEPAKALWGAVCSDHEGHIYEVGEHSRILTFEV